ncbi:MAG TPA: ATP-binding protein, partial [Puia sp.]
YDKGLSVVPQLLAQQDSLIRHNAEQSAILDSIRSLQSQWMAFAAGLVQVWRSIDTSKVSKALYEGQLKKRIGKKINDEIARQFSAFDKIEYSNRNIHSYNLARSIRNTHIYSLTFFGLTIIIGVLTTIYIIALISKRIKSLAKLAEDISQGNFTHVSDEKKDELTNLSSSLNIMSDSLRKNINELKNRNAELDKFAYVVSHDLKAPLRGINNVTKWIEEDMETELSPKLSEYLGIIGQRTKRMEDLINGLLDYARVTKKTDSEMTDVTELVRQITNDIVPRNFLVQIEPLPVIFTERLKLRQVFSNLISNAVKFSVPEKGSVLITCRELTSHYEFSVKDTGIGIEEEYHTRIFEMFQTLREKDDKENTGIGLAIIKKILDELNCSIRVNSNVGNGAEFIFTWPH